MGWHNGGSAHVLPLSRSQDSRTRRHMKFSSLRAEKISRPTLTFPIAPKPSLCSPQSSSIGFIVSPTSEAPLGSVR